MALRQNARFKNLCLCILEAVKQILSIRRLGIGLPNEKKGKKAMYKTALMYKA